MSATVAADLEGNQMLYERETLRSEGISFAQEHAVVARQPYSPKHTPLPAPEADAIDFAWESRLLRLIDAYNKAVIDKRKAPR